MIISQLALRVQKQYALDAVRMYKAVEIVNKKEIKLLPSGNYAAKSHSQNGAPVEYMVNPRSESCNCPDCEQSGNLCKHLVAWLLLRELKKESAQNIARVVAETIQEQSQIAQDRIAYKTMLIGLHANQQERELAARAKRDAMKRVEWVEELDVA